MRGQGRRGRESSHGGSQRHAWNLPRSRYAQRPSLVVQQGDSGGQGGRGYVCFRHFHALSHSEHFVPIQVSY